MIRLRFAPAALLLLAACAPASSRPIPAAIPAAPPVASPTGLPGIARLTPEDERWVESTLAGLPLRDRVAQMVIPRISGQYMAIGDEEYVRVRNLVAEQRVGGLIVARGGPLDVATKLNELQRLAPLPLLVTADMEHGTNTLGGSGSTFPPLMAFGAAGDPQLAYEMGRVTAREARMVGVHMAYAPVVDVNNNPANPIINTRSYGQDPGGAGRLAAAHIRGLQENGMLATAKHFPGHGDTGTDSHLDLPVISVDRARADAVELPPFRAAMEAGVAAVMSAHIAFPALTGDSVPATLNPKLLTGLLQRELGFRGLVVTDALDMGGIVRRHGNAEAAVLAVLAGADVLLMPPEVPVAINAVTEAVQRGQIPEERINSSVRKLLRTKAGLGLHRVRLVEVGRIPQVVGTPDHLAIVERVAERSLTLVRDRDARVPLDASRLQRVLSVVYTDDFDATAGRTLQRALTARIPGLQTIYLDGRAEATELERLAAAADSAELVLFTPFVRVRAYKGDVAIAEPVARWVGRVASRRPTVVAAFGNPYVLAQFPEVGTYLLAWGQEDAAQRATARALLGEIPVTGRLPISLPPFHALGTGIERPVRSSVAPR